MIVRPRFSSTVSQPEQVAGKQASTEPEAVKKQPATLEPEFYIPLPKPRSRWTRWISASLDWLFPERVMTPKEQRIARLIDKFAEDFKSGALFPLDDEVEVERDGGWTEERYLKLATKSGKGYTFQAHYNDYQKDPRKFWGWGTNKLTADDGQTELCLVSDKKNTKIKHVEYTNEKLGLSVQSKNAHLLKRLTQLFEALNLVVVTRLAEKALADSMHKRLQKAEHLRRQERELPDFYI